VPVLGTLFAVLVAVATTEEDPSARVRLRWSAPAECPKDAQVRAYIADALTGSDGRSRPVSADASVEARLERAGTTYVLDVTIRAEDLVAHKQIRASQCDLLARTTGVLVAISVDPDTTSEELTSLMDERARSLQTDTPGEPGSFVPTPPGATNPERPEEPMSSRALPPAVASESTANAETTSGKAPVVYDPLRPAPPTAIDAALRLTGGGQAGTLPGFSGGVGLSLAATGHLWRAELGFGYWFPRRATFEDATDVGARIQLWSVGLRGCGVPTLGHVEIPLCAGPEAGQMRARGFGAPVNLDVRSWWVAAALAPGVVWLPRPWVGLFLGAEGFVNIVRPGYTGEGHPELFTTAAVSLRVLAGLEFRVASRVLGSKN
jgi:hypothetical protein